jgi:hypothetical protein
MWEKMNAERKYEIKKGICNRTQYPFLTIKQLKKDCKRKDTEKNNKKKLIYQHA